MKEAFLSPNVVTEVSYETALHIDDRPTSVAFVGSSYVAITVLHLIVDYPPDPTISSV